MKLYKSKRKLIKKKQKKLKKIQKREINLNKKQKIQQQKFTQNQQKRKSETSIQDIKIYPHDEQSFQNGNQNKFNDKQDGYSECIKDQTNHNLIQQKQSFSNQSPQNSEAIQNKQILDKDQNLENENISQNKLDIGSQSLTTQGSLPKKGLQGFKENMEKKLMKFKNNKTLLNLNKLDIKINKLQEEIYNLQMKYQDGKKREFMIDHFVGKAIISFQTETQKDKILEIYGDKQNPLCGFLKQNVEQLQFQGQALELEEAPYPKDIYWQNLKYNKSDQFKRQCISFGVNFCGMLICLLVNWLMVAWQQYNNDSHFLQNLISIIASILNSILNFAIIEMIEYLGSQYELVEFEISSFGARVVTNMLSFSFYLPVLPIIGFFTLISLILLYYTYKYVLLRNRSVSFQYGNEISVELTDLLEYIIPVFCASQIIFYSIVTDQQIQYILGSIGVFLGLIVVFVPMDSITKLIFKRIQAKPNDEDFQTAKQHFKTTYAQSNPAIDLIEKNLILKQAQQYGTSKIKQAFEKTLQPQKQNNVDVVIEI
ncbi:hypothetical protein PPERSA_02137 [Pseudocohnilembus persalinus]|uniref:CSC1/OSCA1-like cytosolic domain-containing protein n=1 Tax=Pseudocohnilembus persalinus TaxID=266149 RepID=A0A0V0Q7M2_PSEPJ|nr:hypothetical protein PPERSA_02137 [Pseudocohnilembus persalinus]|eukprot:KRW98159.1 hypothetical protein PPERSA_02137 [Pseudocohnilembus persalinus]